MRIFSEILSKYMEILRKIKRYDCSNSAFENVKASVIGCFSNPTEAAILA